MEELIVEGITPFDLKLIKSIIETYPVTIAGDISSEEISGLHDKLTQIVEALTVEE